MTIDFQKGGATDLELRFDFSSDQETAIRSELAERGRWTPSFEYGYYLADGTLCTQITNVVAIRPKGYAGAMSSAAPVGSEEL